ncbi:anti-sigma factor [Nioella nitratireducens]|uniref:anti-sigma factor n=1 Tax=Nioella nitratireducens TaxID=1287720 RepID=UPI0008FD47AC|nr:anti-sigma factor [Nioella nitratireducens]
MSDRPDIPPDDSARAAEYVLGLLPVQEAREMRAELGQNAALRAEVLAWERRFADIAENEVEPVTPPAGVEAQIMAHLFREERRPWWQRFGLGQVVGVAGLAAIVALGVLFYSNLTQPLLVPEYTAQIVGEGDSLILSAALDADTGELLITRDIGTVTTGRAQELWLIAGEAAPVSLGLLAEDTETVLNVPQDLAARFEGGVLAVSDEPPGGSPTGAPTGAVLAVGEVNTI